MVWTLAVFCGILLVGLVLALIWGVRNKAEAADVAAAEGHAEVSQAQADKIKQLETQLAEKWAREKEDVEKRIDAAADLNALLELARKLRADGASTRPD